jgi:hypothetical protein
VADENKIVGFWAPKVLDGYVAPELSSLDKCSAPEITEPAEYFATFFLTDVFNGPNVSEALRPLLVTFLRRWKVAINEYRSGRQSLLKYVSNLTSTNNQTGLFLTALASFDHCVIDAYVAMITMNRLIRDASKGKVPNLFTQGHGSVPDRLRELYDSVRHFDDRVIDGQPMEYPAPMWITNQGLKCRLRPPLERPTCHRRRDGWKPRVRDGQKPHAEVTFVELADFLNDLTEKAHIPSDPDYRNQQLASAHPSGPLLEHAMRDA